MHEIASQNQFDELFLLQQTFNREERFVCIYNFYSIKLSKWDYFSSTKIQ
jgi:hypothetical protein